MISKKQQTQILSGYLTLGFNLALRIVILVVIVDATVIFRRSSSRYVMYASLSMTPPI